MFTLSHNGNIYASQHPSESDGKIAPLFHHLEFAEEHLSHTDPTCAWQITPVNELEPWLDYLLSQRFTHFYEVDTSNGGTTHEITAYLNSIRSWRHGRQILGG